MTKQGAGTSSAARLREEARERAVRSAAAAALGRKGGAAGRGTAKRRDVDYAALGRKGGAAKGKKEQG